MVELFLKYSDVSDDEESNETDPSGGPSSAPADLENTRSDVRSMPLI